MLWYPLSIQRCTLCASQTTPPVTLHHATVNQPRPNNMLRLGAKADRPNRGGYDRGEISINVDRSGYRRRPRSRWIATARRVNGITSGIGASGWEDEENTRRGIVGLTKKIKCLARVRMRVCRREKLVVGAYRRHERAIANRRMSRYCWFDAMLSCRKFAIISSCSVEWKRERVCWVRPRG
jgi:hypothetical protein